MFSKIQNKIATGLVALSLLVVPALAFAAPASAQTQVQNGLCKGSTLTFTEQNGAAANDGSCTAVEADGSADKVNDTVALVVNIFSWVVGVVAVIMIIVGGFKYITSGGDSGKVTSAKNSIIYAVIGLVIVALAQIIVQFVLTKVTT